MHKVKVAPDSLKSSKAWLRYKKNKYNKYIKPQTVTPCEENKKEKK